MARWSGLSSALGGLVIDPSGIGATRQTGWSGCVAAIIRINAVFTKEMLLAEPIDAAEHGNEMRHANGDVLALFGRESWMLRGRLVEPKPECNPD
jgi:hypothetical protein